MALAGACSSSGDDPERGLDALGTPSFEPGEPTSSTAPVAVEGGPATSSPTTAPPGEASAETTSTVTVASGSAPAPVPGPATERRVVSFQDPIGDAVGGLDDDPPAWTDLAGGALERQGDAYRLTVRLGGEAPQRAPGSETMNIATFYDVDGDGSIDHEIWVNLDGEGWGPVRYDDQGGIAPGEESRVTIEVEGDSVVLAFPASIIDAPERLRFSIASEYGDLEVIGTDFARRDDAPDGDRAVHFP